MVSDSRTFALMRVMCFCFAPTAYIFAVEQNKNAMKQNTKEWIQYGSALVMIGSGMLLTFLCFFLNQYEISDSVLWYVAQALVYAGSIFGVGMYIRTKMGDVSNDIKSYVDEKIRDR